MNLNTLLELSKNDMPSSFISLYTWNIVFLSLWFAVMTNLASSVESGLHTDIVISFISGLMAMDILIPLFILQSSDNRGISGSIFSVLINLSNHNYRYSVTSQIYD